MIATATTTAVNFDLARCVVFDLEVYPGRWCVGFHGPDQRGKLTTFVVDGDRNKLAKTLDQLRDRGMILVGYNSSHFDIRVIKCILNGHDPYEPAQQIIGGCLCDPYRDFSDFQCDSIDLEARLRRGGTFPGLKTVAANMGRPTLRELPYPPDAVLTNEQWDEVKAYNRIDLGHTWALLQLYAPELQALASLSEELDQDMRSTSSPQLVERTFLEAYRKKHRGNDPARWGVPDAVSYRPVEGVSKPRTPEAAAWFDQITTNPIPIITKGSRPKPDVPAAHFSIGDLKLSAGAGGLHSIDSARVYYSTPKSRVVSVDVASFYPSLIASKGISPRAYGAIGAATYSDILERRLRIKAEAKTVSDPEENKRLEVQATALKLILNSTFGKFGDCYSSLFDPEALLAVTLSGQLMLIDLIERLTEAKVRVISANTDGLFLRVPRNGKRWRKILARWQRDTEMKLEVDGLKRLVILATNIYATLDARGKVKRRGDKLKGSLSPTTAPNALVVNDAIALALLRDVPPERTVWACNDLVRFCRVSKRSAKVLDAVLVDDAAQTETQLPKITRWYRAKDSQRRIVHRLGNDRHTTPPDASNVSLALDLVDGETPDDLDRSWYIARARRVVQKVPGYRHRSVKRLELHALAMEARTKGLLPIPKWDGKAQLPGSDPSSPTLLWDWSRIKTIGTYTGPAAGVLVLDVDEFERFHKWVEKDNDPLFGDRWKTLDDCLVSVRGETTAEAVRTGRGRGKLVFRLDAGPDHPLSKLAVGHWKKARGVEVFYGKGVPSILGEYPGDEPYRLDGSLGDTPAWLLEGLAPKVKKVSGKAQENGHAVTSGPNWEFAKMDLQRVVDLRDILRGRFQELANGSVGWETAEDSKTGRPIVVGRCPFPHDSGESDPRDLSIGYHDDGPYYHCWHASCPGKALVNDWLKAEYGPKKASGPGPAGGSTTAANPSGKIDLSWVTLDLATLADAAKELEDTAYAWDLWIPRSSITAIVAPPGVGKTRIVAEWCKRFWFNETMPDGVVSSFPACTKTLWLCYDRNWRGLIRSYTQFGAPMESVLLPARRGKALWLPDFDKPETMDLLREVIAVHKPGLVVIDTTTYASAFNTGKPNEAKIAYDPIMDVLMETRCPGLGLTHTNNEGGVLNKRFLERCRVRIDITRPDPACKDRLRVEVTKSDDKVPPPLGATFTDTAIVYDNKPPEAPEAPKRGRKPTMGPGMADFLWEYLQAGSACVVDIVGAARDKGLLKSPTKEEPKPSISPLYAARDWMTRQHPGKTIRQFDTTTSNGKTLKTWEIVDVDTTQPDTGRQPGDDDDEPPF